MDVLNDSGYGCSPAVKRQSTDETKETNVHFYFKSKSSGSKQHDELVGAEQESLASVISQKCPTLRVEKFLFRAKVRGREGLSCVDPFLIPCALIGSNTEVETEEADDIYDNVSQKRLQMTKANSKPQSDVVQLFVSNSSDDRKKKRGITRVHYKTLQYDICVIGYRGQTLREALIQDSRFLNVERFVVNRKLQGGQGPKVDLNEKVENFKGETLQINARKAAPSTDGKCLRNQATTPQSCGVSVSDSVVCETSAKKTIKIAKPALFKKQLEEDAVFVFSKKVDDLTSEEMLSEMRDCLEARAWCSLLGPADRSVTQFKKSIARVAKIEFANQNVVARPATFTRKLCKLLNSVGQIRCGTVLATCFLVNNCMIVTNYHVVERILKARRASVPGNHREVFVSFDYEEIGGWDSSHKYKLLSFLEKQNIYSKKLDYAFLHLEQEVVEREAFTEEGERKALGLGGRVTSIVPEEGKLCIVGHPSGLQKQDELCPIVPLHEDRRSLEIERRIREKEQQCHDRPFNCRMMSSLSQDKKCVHMYYPALRKLKCDTSKVTYDVGAMFEGSSGAPVLNMNCEIVALHTEGFRLDDTSVMEVGVTFNAIIHDLKSRRFHKFVDKHFPNRQEEVPMEWEM